MKRTVFDIWRARLGELHSRFQNWRPEISWFFGKLFLTFVLLNIASYWLAMILVFPEYAMGPDTWYYFKIQFPVGVLGALFDSLSFFVTLWLIHRALASDRASLFVGHLSIDLVIAALATCWVLFVFIVSGWIVNWMENRNYRRTEQGNIVVTEQQSSEGNHSTTNTEGSSSTLDRKEKGHQEAENPDDLNQIEIRSKIYVNRLVRALRNPLGNLRNILFGLILGLSAMLPTTLHLTMFLGACYTYVRKGKNP